MVKIDGLYSKVLSFALTELIEGLTSERALPLTGVIFSLLLLY